MTTASTNSDDEILTMHHANSVLRHKQVLRTITAGRLRQPTRYQVSVHRTSVWVPHVCRLRGIRHCLLLAAVGVVVCAAADILLL